MAEIGWIGLSEEGVRCRKVRTPQMPWCDMRGTHHAADPIVKGPRHYSFLSLQSPSTLSWAQVRYMYGGCAEHIQRTTTRVIRSVKGLPYLSVPVAGESHLQSCWRRGVIRDKRAQRTVIHGCMQGQRSSKRMGRCFVELTTAWAAVRVFSKVFEGQWKHKK